MESFPVDALKKLREPFPAHQISKLPKPTKAQTEEVRADYKNGIRCEICGTWHHPKVVHLDYVGHAALTDRLLDTDPLWGWAPMALDSEGLPKIDKNGGMWINLTVCGVTRPGYGHAGEKIGGDATKEIIGDALRNAAMRFGAALDLWHKGDLHLEEETPEARPAALTPQGWNTDELSAFETILDRAYAAFDRGGKPEAFDAFAKKWKGMRVGPADPVLEAMAAFVVKLEAAANKKQSESREEPT